MSKQNQYQISTQDGGSELNFFTTAKSHKEALSNLINNSFDFKNICKGDKDMTITIKKF